MKKYILPILAISMLVAIPVLPVLADLPAGEIPAAGSLDIWTILKKVLDWFFNIVIIIGALYIVYAGWIYITAGGDDEKAKKGLSGLVQALIGIGIALLAKSLIYVVSTFIIGTGTTF